MECDDSATQDCPLETSSANFSVRISNSKKKTKSSKNDCMSVLTIGNNFPKPKRGEINKEETKKCDDSRHEAIRDETIRDEAISCVTVDSNCNLRTSKKKRDLSPAMGDQLDETKLEAIGFATRTSEEPAIPNMELNLPAASESFLKSTSEDFSPINILTSLIPEMYYERYPKPVDTTDRFVCKWCKPKTRVDINKYKFKESYRLVLHYLKHHKDIPLEDYGFKCQHCSASFFHAKRLETHLCHELYKPKRNLYSRRLPKDIFMKRCSFCEKIFVSHKRYHMHLHPNGCQFEEKKHSVSSLEAFDHMKCKFCNETFLFEQDYRVHMTTRPTNSVFAKTMGEFKCRKVSLQYFECPICLEKYKNEIIFLQHIHHDHTIEEYEYRCDRCKKPFLHEANYKEHVSNMSSFPSCIDFDACRTIPIKCDGDKGIYRINRERNTTLYPCPDSSCSSVFISTSDLHCHMRRHHNLSPQWRCDKCQMTFLTEIEYDDHINQWQCPFCQDSKIFSFRRELVDHCTNVHRSKSRCNDMPSEIQQSLHVHQQNNHTGSENMLKVCPFCGVKDEQVNLYRHIKSFHAYKLPPPEKLFSCELCEHKSLFVTKQSLDRHIGSIHQKSEITECDVCHKTFAQKATMMRHRRIHLDIKPFKCEICDLSFTQKTGMCSHKERHYNKDGTLKSAEEIKQQVEIIKEQREKQNAKNKSPSKRTHRPKVKTSLVQSQDRKSKKAQKGNKIVEKNPNSRDGMILPKSRRSRRTNCNMCGSLFSDVNELNFHNCTNDDKSYNHDPVETTGVDESTIENFMSYEHKCDKCLKDFATEKRLETHRCPNSNGKV